jgi:hypothetical protein
VAVTLPCLVPYQPSYVFPFTLSVMVLAGSAIGVIFGYLRERNAALAFAWMILACMMNLPSLVSHYVDGSRFDMRAAAKYVEDNWNSSDHVTGHSMGLFGYYANRSRPAILPPSAMTVPTLQGLVTCQGRVWVVLSSTRWGLPKDVRQWLGTHCSHELTVRRSRFDYADYSVDVFLYTPSGKR